MTDYVAPGQPGSKATFKARYDHWIGGEYVKPSSGQYFENVTPITGKVFCEIARGNAADIDKALERRSPSQFYFSELFSTRYKFLINRLDGLAMQTQAFFCCTASVLV